MVTSLDFEKGYNACLPQYSLLKDLANDTIFMGQYYILNILSLTFKKLICCFFIGTDVGLRTIEIIRVSQLFCFFSNLCCIICTSFPQYNILDC